MKQLSDKYDAINGGRNFINYVKNVQDAIDKK